MMDVFLILLIMLAVLYAYLAYKQAADQKGPLIAVGYIGGILLSAIAGYQLGTLLCTAASCSSPNAGNLCGLPGYVICGPVLSCIFAFGYPALWSKYQSLRQNFAAKLLEDRIEALEKPSQPEHPEDAPSTPSGAIIYAGCLRHLSAHLLDSLICLPIMVGIWWLDNQSRLFSLYLLFPSVAVSAWYNIYLAKRYGGTPGKILLGIEIKLTDSLPVTYRAAILRHIVLLVLTIAQLLAMSLAVFQLTDAEYLSIAVVARTTRLAELAPSWYQLIEQLTQFWIWSEFIIMLTNSKRQAFQDFFGETIVVRKQNRDERLAA